MFPESAASIRCHTNLFIRGAMSYPPQSAGISEPLPLRAYNPRDSDAVSYPSFQGGFFGVRYAKAVAGQPARNLCNL